MDEEEKMNHRDITQEKRERFLGFWCKMVIKT